MVAAAENGGPCPVKNRCAESCPSTKVWWRVWCPRTKRIPGGYPRTILDVPIHRLEGDGTEIWRSSADPAARSEESGQRREGPGEGGGEGLKRFAKGMKGNFQAVNQTRNAGRCLSAGLVTVLEFVPVLSLLKNQWKGHGATNALRYHVLNRRERFAFRTCSTYVQG